jgi:hypothetical protein
MRAVSRPTWQKFAAELEVSKPFKYGSEGITLYAKRDSGKGWTPESYFDVSQTVFRLRPIKLAEYKNEELFFSGVLASSPAQIVFTDDEALLPAGKRAHFEPLTGELTVGPQAGYEFENYFKDLVPEVCHSILSDGDAAYDKAANMHICDMAYLIISFAYNISNSQGFSDDPEEDFGFFAHREWATITGLDSDELFYAIRKARAAAFKIIGSLKKKGLPPLSDKLEIEERETEV